MQCADREVPCAEAYVLSNAGEELSSEPLQTAVRNLIEINEHRAGYPDDHNRKLTSCKFLVSSRTEVRSRCPIVGHVRVLSSDYSGSRRVVL